MPHIFRFHKGSNVNILDWKSSDRIVTGDIREVADRTDIISSSAGSSIPTPIARIFLFKTAFDLVGKQIYDGKDPGTSIYAALVSETLDLLEMLYLRGSDPNVFRYEKWTFDKDKDDFFGSGAHHKLLTLSFKQAAEQEPFKSSRLETILIYYKEKGKEILIGGTSPFTFVFLSPNFKRKKTEKRFGDITGLSSHEYLFTNNYKQLHERDSSFISYIKDLTGKAGSSFDTFTDYFNWTQGRFEKDNPKKFESISLELEDINYGDIPLVAGNVHIQQISAKDAQLKVSKHSDFKMDLPPDAPYADKALVPLFLYSNMDLYGQYTSPSNIWSNKTIISALLYRETKIEEFKNRELPGISGIKYPFLSKFDFFEKSLVMLPDYTLDDERFFTLIEDQNFLLPIKPIFFQFFPLKDIRKYIKINRTPTGHGNDPEVTVTLSIPITGPTMMKRVITLSQTYKRNPQTDKEIDRDKYPFTDYRGLLGIFPFIHAKDTDLRFTNNYTIASYEKTNDGDPVNNVLFFKNDGITTVKAPPTKRAEYTDVNTRSTYYQVKESFELIQINFSKLSITQGGLIIPQFKEVVNGKDEYIYAIDFGTSNTHIEYSRIDNNQAVGVKPFEISEDGMIMAMLNKPITVQERDATNEYKDYADINSFGRIIDSVRIITMREFMPFQIGPPKSDIAEFPNVRFPFRTAVFESQNTGDPQLFAHANIGFNIDRDVLVYNQGYQTNIKWQLESSLTDIAKQNRVKLFFRQLLLMIRSHALLLNKVDTNKYIACNINKVKIAMSYPISMDSDLKGTLINYFTDEMNSVFHIEKNTENTDNNRLIEVTESIAPYYQLLKTDNNIKHDIYCNIDVGGGTSDIVLVKYGANDADKSLKRNQNVLTCYCNSIMFAGKQLWGSVSDDYNPEDNGFLSFYLKLLQTRNRTAYNKLQTIIDSKNIRTEDIVSYLFNDDKYRFDQIFIECRELKVPLLLHYSALLYYIAKSCKEKAMELPKTLSFSGKGSEYISIIFNSRDHLKMFTKKALSLFSGLPGNNEFNIPLTVNPKAITAQGSAIYGSKPLRKMEEDIFDSGSSDTGTEPLIYPVKDEYHGLRNTDTDIKTHNYGDFEDGKPAYESVMFNCVEFLDIFFGDADLVRGSERSLNITNMARYKSFFMGPDPSFNVLRSGMLRNSYKTALGDKDPTKNVDDSPFFFPFKTSLIELSKLIANEAIKSKGL